MVVFSAHYDHVGTDPWNFDIYNGANDDASGVAAVLALADYFALRKDNERTLVFCLFAGEELGLYGSAAFTKIITPADIKAVFNIEMIGKSNVTDKGSFFITGEERSDMSAIMKKNLYGEDITIKKYYDRSSLFERSDNYNFFLRGIPAHSIMCSDDWEQCYHKPCDDAAFLDYNKMSTVIRAIAKSAETIISGEDTPKLK
jgi:Zn-dependent M28 family amino/carboxypeptidase